MTTRRTRRGLEYTVCGGVLLGTLGIPLEEAGQPPAGAVWFRCLFGAVALGLVLVVRGEVRELALRGRALGFVVAASLLMLLSWWLFFESILRTSIALATLVFHLQPFVVMALGAWWLGERVRPVQWIATGVALGGLALVSGVPSAMAGADRLGPGEAVGLAMCVGGAVSYALVVVLAKRVQAGVARGAGAKATGRAPGPLVIAWWQCAIGTLCLAWWPLRHGLPAEPVAWAWLAGLGALNTGLAYALVYADVAQLPSGRVALLQFVYPATAVAVDASVYGRALDPVQTLGFGLMVGALVVAVRAGDAPVPERASTGPDRP